MAKDHAVDQRARDPYAARACVAIAACSLAILLTQFVYRGHDDNRLTSWAWVFTVADIRWLLPVHVGALLLAYLLSKGDLPSRWPKTLLFLASFAIAIPFWSEPEVILDASRYFTQAKHLELYGLEYFLRGWGGQIGAWTDLPLIPLLYGLIFSLAGESRICIQLFTTLLFSASVVLTYRVGETLWDKTTGFQAGTLMLGMPYLLTQVPLMLVDVPTMFFIALAVFATLKALESGGAGRIALASVAVLLAFWTKYSAWLFLSVLPVIVVVRLRPSPRPVILRALALATVSLLLIGATLLPLLDVVSRQLVLLRSYQLPGLARWEETSVSTFLFQIHPFVTAAALVSVYAAFRTRDSRYAIILWLPALVVLMGINRIRYILPVFPMLALMAAHGLRQIRQERIQSYVVLAIVTSSVALAILGFRPFLQGTSAVNLQRAGEYLDSLDVPEIEVITLQQRFVAVNPAVSVPLLDIHTAKRLVFRPEEIAAAERGSSTSPLRFTWEHRNPAYYQPAPTTPEEMQVVAVIADDDFQPLPDRIAQKLSGYRLSGTFIESEKLYDYKTVVKVYRLDQYRQRGSK